MSDLYNDGRSTTAGNTGASYETTEKIEKDKCFRSLESLITVLILKIILY